MGEVQTFAIRERKEPSGHLVLGVEGEIDLAVADQLEEALARAAERAERIAVDLSECTFIDSTGIAVLLRAHNRPDGPALTVLRPSGQVLRVFEVTGLTTNNGFVVDALE
jgi:anti-anti-sigma factor